MRRKPDSHLQQRRTLEKRLSDWRSLASDARPQSGWIKAIRGALGMTTEQLAKRMSSGQASIVRTETRESEDKVTLETLRRAAEAMRCKFVYAFVPHERFGSLEAIVERRAELLAHRLMSTVDHSMRLEAQGVAAEESAEQVKRLAAELIATNDSRIWGMDLE